MTNNRVSMFRQYEAQRDPDHPKICARCHLVWREYSPVRDPHCHCFDHEYADWRRESDKEIAKIGKHTCGSTHYQGCECQRERMAKLEQLVRDAQHWMEYAANNINPHASEVAGAWLARYCEMFPEVE